MSKKITLIVTVVALAVVAIISVNLLQNTDQPVDAGQPAVGSGASLASGIPPKLVDFNLVNVVTGPEAVQSITRLHGTGIDIVNGFMAEYVASDESNMFVLWVTESRDDEEARSLFSLMDGKMPSSQMFLNRKEVEIGGRKYIYVTGAGMENYYWVEGKKNYWVGIMAGDDEEILELVVNNF